MASSLPLAAAQISIEDLQRGVINHVIGLELPAPASGIFWWPAQSTDGHSTDTWAIPEGARGIIDPTLDLTQLNLTRVGYIVAKAMQDYGFVICDQGGFLIRAYHSFSYTTQGLADPAPIQLGGVHGWGVLANFPWDHIQFLPQGYGQ